MQEEKLMKEGVVDWKVVSGSYSKFVSTGNSAKSSCKEWILGSHQSIYCLNTHSNIISKLMHNRQVHLLPLKGKSPERNRIALPTKLTFNRWLHFRENQGSWTETKDEKTALPLLLCANLFHFPTLTFSLSLQCFFLTAYQQFFLRIQLKVRLHSTLTHPFFCRRLPSIHLIYTHYTVF